MKHFILLLIAAISLQNVTAQEVTQTILVEHYTNTRCGQCAQRNPAMFSLLENYNEVHLAYYPSSPFSSCIFSMHNPTEADGRTNYYNIFGSTPRVVLNGESVPGSTTLLQQSRIEAEVPNMTPFTIDVKQEYLTFDSVKVTVIISTVAITTFTDLNLQVMLAEKLINYNAPNGEIEHPDVFRKALYGLNGLSFTVPSNGSDITFETTYTIDPDWIKEDMEVIAFIQDNTDKSVKQSAITTRLGNDPTAIKSLNEASIYLFPNPTSYILNIDGLTKGTSIVIYNILGEKVLKTSILNNSINIQKLNQGIYFFEVFVEGKRFVQKFTKK